MYYRGQGRLYGAKHNQDGTLGKIFFFGNVPQFEINFRDGELEIHFEEISDETLEIITGSEVRKTTVDEFIPLSEANEPRPAWEQKQDFRDRFAGQDVSAFEINYQSNIPIALFFEGVNTCYSKNVQHQEANSGMRLTKKRQTHFMRIELFKVYFCAANGLEAITNDISLFKVSGVTYRNDKNKLGKVYSFFGEEEVKERSANV